MSGFYKKILAVVLISAAFIISGCDIFQKEGGSFSVKFMWPDEGKPDFSDETYYAWIDMREWVNGKADDVRILIKEGPIAFDSKGSLNLQLKDLTYGSNRVVVVEVRKSNQDQDRTLYYGVSSVFSLEPGKRTDVPVEMNLLPTPGTDGGTSSFSIVVYKEGEKTTSTNEPEVSVRLLNAEGDRLAISNRLDLLDVQINNEDREYNGSKIIDFADLDKVEDKVFELTEWNILAGREGSEQGDGEKVIYARVVDSLGYRSEMAYASVNLDTTSPTVSNVIVSPSGEPGLAKIGTEIVVRFIINEPLEEFVFHSDGLEFEDKSVGFDKIFSYIVTDNDEDGSVYKFRVSATDLAGNKLEEFLLGSVMIDSTIPEVIDFSISKSKVKIEEEFSVDLEVSEKLAGINVLVGAKSISEKCDLQEDSETKYRCLHKADIDGDEGDGVKQIAVMLTDMAGNSVSETLKKNGEPVVIEYDVTPPILASGVILPQIVNRSHEEVTINFSFVEPVKITVEDLKVVPESGLVFDCGDVSVYSKSFSCKALFEKEDSRVAQYSVTISSEDEVGNRREDVEVGIISVDRLPPTLSSSDVFPEAVRLEEKFTLTFGVSEELMTDPVVRVGDKTFPGSSCSYDGGTEIFTCEHHANKDGDEPDGIKMISVYIVDKAGNASTEIFPKSISYDATPPVLINPVFIPGPKINLYDSLFWVRFSFSERVRLDDSFVFSYTTDEGDALGKEFSCSHTDGIGQSFQCAIAFSEEEKFQGKYTFYVDATDISGNRLPQNGVLNRIGTVNIDRKAPVVQNITAVPDKVNADTDYVEVAFQTDKPIKVGVDPEVRIGPNLLSIIPHSQNAERTAFVYRVSNLQMAYDGNHTVNIKAQDSHGNIGEGFFGAIQFDRTRPSVISKNINTAVAKQGDEIVVSVTFSEEMTVETVKIEDEGLGLNKDVPNSTERFFVYRYTVLSSDAGAKERSYTISVTGSDSFGNGMTGWYTIGSVELDLTPPDAEVTDFVITTATSDVYDVSGMPVASEYQPGIDFSFKLSNRSDMNGVPSVFIGNSTALSTCDPVSGDMFNCSGSYNVTGFEGEGVKMVTVEYYDSAGNRGAAQPGAVVFDFSGPRLVAVSMLREPAFAPSRNNSLKVQHYSPIDPLTDQKVEIILSMYADEKIGGYPVSISNLPCLEDFVLIESEMIIENSVSYRGYVNDCFGTYQPLIEWTDMVGNQSFRQSDWIASVVAGQPDSLDVRREYITYLRKPFGSIDSSSAPKFSVSASSGTVWNSDIAMVMFYTETGILAGSTVVLEDGSFTVESLTGGDVPVIYINPVTFAGTKIPVKDSAGNLLDIRSVLQPVPNVVWTANLNNKISGSVWPNPTRFLNSPDRKMYLERNPLQNAYEVSQLPSSVTPGIQIFRRNADQIQVYDDSMSSFYREGRAWSYNPLSDTLLVFGGKTVSDGSSSEIWFNDLAQWNGERWSIIEVEGVSPEISSGSSMVYFESRDEYVLFGGGVNSMAYQTLYSETWVFKGSAWAKSPQYGPSARFEGAMAYDPLRKVAVLFGGYIDNAGSLYANDGTWEWDGSKWNSITLSDPEGDGNPQPSVGGMVYSYALKKMVYHDGINGETWLYDGESWHKVSSLGPELRNFRMVYDVERDLVLLYGGKDQSWNLTSKLYSFDGIHWKEESDTGQEIEKHVMWYSRSKASTFSAFGVCASPWYDSCKTMMEWNGSGWKEKSMETHSAVRPALAYYPTKNKAYMFGGEGDSLAHTFNFDGEKWEGVENNHIRPSTTQKHDLIYYQPDDVLLMFEIAPARMWQYDGENWSIRAGTGDPSKILFYKMGYFPPLNHVVFMATTDEASLETWTYNGSAWTLMCRKDHYSGCIQPSFNEYSGVSLSYDPVGEMMFAFIPEDYEEDLQTWRWTGLDWEEVALSDAGDGFPGFLHSVSANYSPTLKKTIVTGTNTAGLFEIWTFNGSSYRKISNDYISGRYFYDSVWMDNIETLLIRGGRSGPLDTDKPVKDYFLVKFPEQVEPSQQYKVPLVYAAIPNGSVVQKIDLTWIGGGTTYDGTGDFDAIAIDYWNFGGWNPFTYSTGSVSSHAVTKESITDPSLIDFMISGVEKNVSFRAYPVMKGAFAGEIPEIATSSVEVDIFYNVDGNRRIEEPLNKEYFISTSSVSWEAARQHCLNWGGDLLIINSEAELSAVTQENGGAFEGEYWIGVNDIYENLVFRAVSGRKIWEGASDGEVFDESYTAWGTGNPYSSAIDNCTFMYKDLWFLSSCLIQRKFICEKSRENKYIVSTQLLNWDNAMTRCSDFGMNLAIINGSVEQKQLESSLGGTIGFWIGYEKKPVNRWTWLNGITGWIGTATGTDYFYNNWAPLFPSSAANSIYGYVDPISGWKWKSSSVTSKYYICEEPSTDFSCSVNGISCDSGDSCCSEICSDYFGKCVSCLETGDSPCTKANQCCDNICNTGSKECVKCLNLTENTCSSAADCCDKGASCASGRCCYDLDNNCNNDSECCAEMLCGEFDACCLSFGFSCLKNSNCCSGLCSGTVGKRSCSCLSESSLCTYNSQCCSNMCYKGGCICLEAGQSCTDNAQCCSSLCNEKTKECADCLPKGSFCILGKECCSGSCFKNSCA